MSITRNQKWWGLGIATSLVATFVGISLMKDRADKVPDVVSSVQVSAQSTVPSRVPGTNTGVINGNIPESEMHQVFPGMERRGRIIREQQTPPKAAEKSEVKAKSVSYASTSMTYVVKEGDWLSTICPSDWPTVATQNGIANPNLIYPGQKIALTEKCNEFEFVATRGGSTKTTLVIAKEEIRVPAVMNAESVAISSAPIREEKGSEKVVDKGSVVPTQVVVGNTTRLRMGDDGLHYCDVNLPEGEKAFQWRQPGLTPIGDDDPAEYLDALAQSEGLPKEAREYFLAELRKGDQGEFVQMDLTYCQYLGTMVGKKMYGKIRPHPHTVLNWPIEVYKRRHSVFGKRKQTDDEMRMNGTARKYVFVVGGDRWVLLRANVCGNLILRREEVAPPPVVVPPPVEPEPILPSPPTVGTCVPRSRPQDCAMPGCVLRVQLPDATPACAASCESAPEMNFDPRRNAKGVHPVVDGTCTLSDEHPLKRLPVLDENRPPLTVVRSGGSTPEELCRTYRNIQIGTLQCVQSE